ncbi:1-acyl-sn-glycerol-3-phosphate acyltransferase [Deinococcus irradiatisoli]|uniref:1-acyl-sn-glycerol-3-phosphate acyltransferase n=1 Tax=Deinococcus irradiatisoli TaxID=2202254 RepID=A0A2Z3JJI4_9DEIO|nr:lysophospholipid acyltransferase family protein [Deinococcus irradiatisoli]AWN24146.1 1-acyl-sn-glycerol-3-phosphate acyltransferase [Deinococcus irradiatisoli]
MTSPAFDPFEWTLRSTIRRSVRQSLRGLWVRGDVPLGAAVLAPSHHSWWDGYALRELAWQLGQPFQVLMTERQLENFPFLRLAGALGDREVRPALRALQQDCWVVVFPEGQLEAPGTLRRVQPGAAWLAHKSGAALYPVALRVVLRGQPQPEAYLRFGPPVAGPDLPAALKRELELLDAELLASDPEEPLAGYLRWVGRAAFHADPPNLAARWLARLTRNAADK